MKRGEWLACVLVCGLWWLETPATLSAAQLEALPEGETGIASMYPGDAGIGKDAAVLFAHDFENDANASDLRRVWDTVFHDETIRITEAPEDVHAGRKALELTFPRRDGDVGNGLMKRLAEERDTLYLRFYEKMDKELNIKGAGSFHNGGAISARYHINGGSTPGQRADGRNKFLVSYECSVYSDAPPPGHLSVYVYHPEQRQSYGDIFFPTGIVQPNTSLPHQFGDQFVPRPNVLPALGRYTCYEFMVRANTPGARDGRIACWVDGKLVADYPNLRLRDVPSLKIDVLTIGGYINPNRVRTNTLWFDDVVAASSYIGPMRRLEPKRDQAQTVKKATKPRAESPSPTRNELGS
jgi:hypothetical protein